MKSSTRLDSVVFQLTPTRTRCDLVITANGKTKKIASGLLNPFLAHLKAVREQIGKGGYSIILEPDNKSDGSWFTKGTVERFVRFVSTPEILERVYTIESEILQIQEAISFQNSNTAGYPSHVEDHQQKHEEVSEGGKVALGSFDEKAIILYKGDVHPTETEGSTHEGNSRVQLLQVLETRKMALQKEQGMAFARAVAADFDVDHLVPLMTFADCFGASRMKEACSRFIHLWKAKHESGQWLEIEAAEVFSPINVSGIKLSDTPDKQKEPSGLSPWDLSASVNNGLSSKTEIQPETDHRVLPHPHEYPPGHLLHSMYPPWPIHPQTGTLPVFQQYPMPMPFYTNYPGNSAFFQPPYPSLDGSTSHSGHRTGRGGDSIDNRDLSSESERHGSDASRRRMQDEMYMVEADTRHREGRMKSGKSMRKKSGVVVIRNINYITSKQHSSGSDSGSDSDTKEDGNLKNRSSDSSKRVHDIRSDDAFMTFNSKEGVSGHKRDDGQWLAFQSFLLRDADEDDNSSKGGTPAAGQGVRRKRQIAAGEDPSIPGGLEVGGAQNGRYSGFHDFSGDTSSKPKPVQDDMLTSRRADGSVYSLDARTDMGLEGMRKQRGAYMRTSIEEDGLMIRGRDMLDSPSTSMDPLIGNGTVSSSNRNNSWSHTTADDSFMVPYRANISGQGGGNDRRAIDIDSEVPVVPPGAGDHTDEAVAHYNYEPNDLNLMPDRVRDSEQVGYYLSLEHELHAQNGGTKKTNDKKEATKDSKLGSKKGMKGPRIGSESKPTSGTMKGTGKPAKLSPSGDARARADKLRNFKADLQKLKKEKEEEQLKRIEALKAERQKRIAAKSKTNPAKSSLPTQQTKKQQPAKPSPSSDKGSKFSDMKPGPSSPLQRSTIRSTSKGSTNSRESPKPGRLSNSVGSKVSRSPSSLFERKDESAGLAPDSKATMARIRRLSEPKSIKYPSASVPQGGEQVSGRRNSDGPKMKKIPAITNLDKAKSTTLPEVKTRTTGGPSDAANKKLLIKDQKTDGSKYSNISAATVNPRGLFQVDEDDSTIIEKKVVMLEQGKPAMGVTDASKEKAGVSNMQMYGYDADRNVKKSVVAGQHGYVGKNVAEFQGKEKPVLDKICESTKARASKPTPTPYAQLSSLEDPCTTNSEYAKAPPTRLQIHEATVTPSVIHTPVSPRQKIEIISDASEQTMVKDSSKGLKALLKFGKKHHASVTIESQGEPDKPDLDFSSTNDYNPTSTGISGEVHTLKSLISQPETGITGGTSSKSSRSFSLFSPFRGKTGDKEIAK
ncbi:COP1-interacting protein 7-like protein [Drosera capensis]